ncbi:MAG: dephospho-CoA kinase [Clostridiaceae bacterium]|nr:dephospho-CoA kinase [Eubacteriales bacterium]
MLIGLTGSIGSGKSTVAKRLKERGAHVLDADAFSRAETDLGAEGLREIVSAFGESVLLENGELDRRKLAEAIFSSEEKRLKLNAILHPRILSAMRARAESILRSDPKAVVVYDVPLLIETGEHSRVDRVWLVTADDETRVARIVARDHCTADEAKARIAAQMPQAEKLAYADEVIENGNDLSALYARVDALYDAVKERYGKA